EASAALDAGPRLDSGALVRRAVRLLADPTTPPPFRAVVVDDAQDLTAAGVDLVVALAAAGARVMVCSCPDVAVDTFRGALPAAAPGRGRRAAWGARAGDRAHRRGRCAAGTAAAGRRPRPRTPPALLPDRRDGGAHGAGPAGRGPADRLRPARPPSS